MIETIKDNFKENKAYWLVMFISFSLLIIYFKSDVKSLIGITLTWTFAISSHKIFIDDLITKKRE